MVWQTHIYRCVQFEITMIMNNLSKQKNTTLLLSVGFFCLFCTQQASALNDAIRFRVSQGTFSDETVIRYLQEATPAFDSKYDAWKRFTSSTEVPSLFTRIEDSLALSINALPPYDTYETE